MALKSNIDKLIIGFVENLSETDQNVLKEGKADKLSYGALVRAVSLQAVVAQKMGYHTHSVILEEAADRLYEASGASSEGVVCCANPPMITVRPYDGAAG